MPSTTEIGFIGWLMEQQTKFETERVGTDGSLYETNTVGYGLTRGVIGEAQEALDELEEIERTEILTPDQEELLARLHEHLRKELCDVQIFLASVFVHAGMTPEQVASLCVAKMGANYDKYRTEYFAGRTVREAMQYARDRHARKLPDRPTELRKTSGRSQPSSGTIFNQSGESEDYTASQGALT